MDGERYVPAFLDERNVDEDIEELKITMHPDIAHLKKNMPGKMITWKKNNVEGLESAEDVSASLRFSQGCLLTESLN